MSNTKRNLFSFFLFFCFSNQLTLIAQVTNISVETSSFVKGESKKLAKFVKEHIEIVLIEQPNITVVDREFFNQTEKERDIQKNEAFMEGSYVEQEKAVGASMIFEVTYEVKGHILNIICLDVETNVKLFVESYKIKRFLVGDYKIDRPKYFGRYIEELIHLAVINLGLNQNLLINIIEISKTKKNKAIEVDLYCDDKCGYKKGNRLSLYTILNNKSNKVRQRMTKIGEIRIVFVESNKIAIAKVTSGEKEVFKYFNEGNIINCRYE